MTSARAGSWSLSAEVTFGRNRSWLLVSLLLGCAPRSAPAERVAADTGAAPADAGTRTGSTDSGTTDLGCEGSQQSLRCSDADARFSTSMSWTAPAADLDGDGGLDLVVSGVDSPMRMLPVPVGSVDGDASTAWIEPGEDDTLWPGAVLDADGDGNADIWITRDQPGVANHDGSYQYVSQTVLLLGPFVGELSTSDAVFAVQGGAVADRATGDLDGDGIPELAATRTGPGVSLFPANERGRRDVGDAPTGVIGYPSDLVIGDVDGDGVDDLLYADQVPYAVIVQLGPIVEWRSEADGDARVVGTGSRLSLADVDGDGAPELLTQDPWELYVLPMVTKGIADIEDAMFTLEGDYYPFQAGDMDGDGRAEVVVDIDHYPHAYLSVWRPTVDGTIRWWRDLDTYLQAPSGRTVVLNDIEDLDGDGRAELRVADLPDDFDGPTRYRVFDADGWLE